MNLIVIAFFILFLGVSACGDGSKSSQSKDNGISKESPIDPPLESPLFTGNAWLSGPGGDEEEQWEYNGLVSVADMQNELDET